MDAVDRTRILALIQYARSRMMAGLELSADDLARRFRLDLFVVERLLESERGRTASEAVVPAAGAQKATREMAPATGSGIVD